MSEPLPRLRGAIVGCGRMGAFTRPEVAATVPSSWLPLNYAEAMRAESDIDFAAVCDADVDVVHRAGELHQVSRRFTDFREMLEDISPDILVIATRTPPKSELIRAAAVAGVRAILCEKPLARSIGEARALCELMSRKKIQFAYGTLRRYMAVYAQAKEIISSGVLGAPRQAIVSMGRSRLFWAHPHSIDIMLFLLGESRVSAVQAALEIRNGLVGEASIDDDPMTDLIHVRFSGGTSGIVTAAPGCDVWIACEKGAVSIRADGAHLQIFIETRPGSGYLAANDVAIAGDPPSGSRSALRALVGALRNPAAPLLDAEFAVEGVRALIAAARSQVSGGAWIDPSDVSPDFSVTTRSGEFTA